MAGSTSGYLNKGDLQVNPTLLYTFRERTALVDRVAELLEMVFRDSTARVS